MYASEGELRLRVDLELGEAWYFWRTFGDRGAYLYVKKRKSCRGAPSTAEGPRGPGTSVPKVP
jgi:hypothetical protein